MKSKLLTYDEVFFESVIDNVDEYVFIVKAFSQASQEAQSALQMMLKQVDPTTRNVIEQMLQEGQKRLQ